MNSRHAFKSCLVATLAALGTYFGMDDPIAAQRDRAEAEAEVQVLTRGPVHEAFAETVTFDPRPGIVVPKMPPDAIEELPPEQRPEGANVTWIPGYSAWDDERDDFLWVSGIWRDLPPGRQWVPGYWTESDSGAQWISGYWADAKVREVQYLPEPPATAEVGPNIDAPSADYIWLPGCWVWHQNRYAWRPGYWAQVQPNWDWIPAHYVWSPRGYVFVDSYYDYSVARRGILFAPVYLDAGIYSRQGYSYSPSTVIDLGLFTAHLFARPRYHHYYFGDYYAANYGDAGFLPWFSYASSGQGYDPFYARQRWDNRRDRGWERRIEADFGRRRDNEDARPPHTLAAQLALNTGAVKSPDKTFAVATSLEQLTKSQDSPRRFQVLDKEEREKIGQRGQEFRKFRQERQTLEAKAAVTSPRDPSKTAEPVKVKLPASPIASKLAETPGKDLALPKAQDAPPLDLKVEPKPRKTGVQAQLPKGDPKVPKADTGLEPSNGKPKVEPRPARPGVEPKPEPKAEPKPLPRGEPKPAPKAEPKPVPKVEPKPAPRVEPKPAPKVEPKPVPKVEPKPAPRVEPKPAPRVEPKPAPRVEPKPAPRVEPKPGPPKGESKDKPKTEEKDKPKK